MTIETFIWPVAASLTKQVKFSVLAAQFADGYEQVARNGINPGAPTWNVSVTGGEGLIAAVEAFLDRHGADTAFNWTAPRAGQILVRATAEGYSTSEAGGGVATLTVVFKRVYVP